MIDSAKCIVLAADGLNFGQCMDLARSIGQHLYAIKIHDLYDEAGSGVVAQLKRAGATRVWVDAKLHDIPNTVKHRATTIKNSGADILTVHASGEVDMMMAAVEAGPEEIYAITILTSLEEEMAHLTYGQPSKAGAIYFARLAKLAGVHGVVSSPKEVGLLKKRPELDSLWKVTPGVRSGGKSTGDQKRFDSPKNAIESGSDMLVIGRQITEAEDPLRALEEIMIEINAS